MLRTPARCRSFYAVLQTGARALLRNRRGQAGVITAILAPIIVGVAALAIDAALWQANQRSLQGAADQAAIAGVNAYVLGAGTDSVGQNTVARRAALAVANSFGYPSCSTADAGCPCSSGYGACVGLPVTTNATACVNAPANCLQVNITEQETRYLSAVVFSSDPIASARATVTVGAGGACVLALDQIPLGGGTPPAAPPSVSIAGSSVMTLTACNLVNNLNDPGATKDESSVTGTSVLQATQGGQILLSQVDQYFGGGRVSPNPIYGTSPAPDPYAGRTPPTVTGCTYTNFGNSGNNSNPANITQFNANTSPLNPGTYCGGLKFTGAGSTGHPIVFNPGIYIMDGGGFTATGNTVITGSQVTIYVTCDNFAIAANVVNNCGGNNYGTITVDGTGGNTPKITLTPPIATTNPPSGTAGISMWISKNAPVSGSAGCGGSCGTALFNGDADLNVSGAIYAPTQAVTYEGGSTSASACSQLVALTVNMSGGHNTTFSQAGCASNSGVAGHGVAQLVE